MYDLFEGETICLRALEPEDMDVLYQWENDTRLWENGAAIVPFSRYLIRQYIAESHRDIFQTGQLRLMMVEKGSRRPAGTLDLYDFDALHGRAGIGILVDREFQRKGYALEGLHCLQRYAFGHLRLHQLYAFVPQRNEASLALFAKAGYERTALLKSWLSARTGYQDVVVMQKIDNK